MKPYVLIALVLLFPIRSFADEYAIGVLAFNGKPQAIERWQPTADYLSERIANAHFNIVPLTHEEFEHALNKGELAFVLTNPGHYVLLEVKFGITRIATFLARHEAQTLKRFGSVIFTRANSPIRELKDLRGGTLAAVSEQAFGGYQLALLEFRRAGLKINEDLDIKWLGFPHADVVDAVLNGSADVGTVRSGTLEKMSAQGQLNLSDLNILNRHETPGYPYLHSTDLYPEWPFSKLPGTDIELSKKVAISLLQMQSTDTAATLANGSGWTIPLNYTSVHDVLHELKVEPYPEEITRLSDFLHAYRVWIGTIVLLFFFTVAALMRLAHTNRQLNQAQLSLRKQQLQLEDTVQERTDELLQTNQTLQIEIASHIEAERELREGCKSLQALHDIFVRDDLDRQQKLNSTVDSIRHHLGMEFAVMTSYRADDVVGTIVSPIGSEVDLPLSQTLSARSVKERQIVNQANVGRWRQYLCCPVFLGGELSCIFEFANTEQFDSEQSTSETRLSSELNQRILNFIAQWAAHESRMLEEEKLLRDRNLQIIRRFQHLSGREMDVLKLVVQGDSTKVMARKLEISPKTVEMHRASLLRKTDARSSTELVQLAVSSGYFDQIQ